MMMRRLACSAVFVCAVFACSTESETPVASGPTDGGALDGRASPDATNPPPFANDAAPQNDAAVQRDAAPPNDAASPRDGGDGGDGAAIRDGGVDAPDAAGFTLTSSAFAAGGAIPDPQGCNGGLPGDGVSPPLAWSDAPTDTRSYAIVMRDVTLGGSNNYHWVIYDIPSSTTSLPGSIARVENPPTPSGAKQTTWSFGPQYGYGGPCPIVGPATHEYEFTVYSFAVANLPAPAIPASPASADERIQANKTGSATLKGTYTKK